VGSPDAAGDDEQRDQALSDGDGGVSRWVPLIALAAITIVLVLQKTKNALLPSSHTPVLWAAELATMAGVLILRSGWARDRQWTAEQERLGTLANNFYEPRRDALVNGGAVAGGVLLRGMGRGVAGRGLLDFEVATAVGAMTGGVAGAVIGLFIGHFWEKRHRLARRDRGGTHGTNA